MPLSRHDTDDFWYSIALEFSDRLDAVRPKLSVVTKRTLKEKARARIAAYAVYCDDPAELKATALSVFDGLTYLRKSRFWEPKQED